MKILKYYLRKLYHLIAFLGLFLFFIVPVKADTTVDILKQDFYSTNIYNGNQCSTSGYTYTDFNTFISNSDNASIFNELYSNVIEMYNQNYSNYYYKTIVHLLSKKNTEFDLYGVVVYRIISATGEYLDGVSQGNQRYLVSYYADGTYYKNYDVDYSDFISEVFPASSISSNNPIRLGCAGSDKYVITTSTDPINYTNQPNYYIPNILFEINIPEQYYPKIENNYTVNITNGNNIIETYSSNENMPALFSQSYVPGVSYTTVNLDNYEYVLLSLKNYNQTQPFQTSLQVKGQIGITPIYNYGQTSKDSITGSQVQDRCNLSYSNFTSYPFYVIQSDLQNNAIYAVKSCTSNSSFKFDNTIFDITYITASNKDNPTITIGNQTYNVIPYSDLPSTATENEENNYIPGQSGSATDTGGLDSAIKTAQDSLSSIWSTFNYFTQFVGQVFSSLPEPLQGILLSAFTISIILGLIKLFVH